MLSYSLELCNEPLVTVNYFSVYSYCFNYMWRCLKCTALALWGASSPVKCPHILCLWWNHTELIISVNGCSHNHGCAHKTHTHTYRYAGLCKHLHLCEEAKQDHQRLISVFAYFIAGYELCCVRNSKTMASHDLLMTPTRHNFSVVIGQHGSLIISDSLLASPVFDPKFILFKILNNYLHFE